MVDFTRIALLVFKMDAGVLVVVVDGDDADDPAAVTVGGCDVNVGFGPKWFKAKPGFGARL